MLKKTIHKARVRCEFDFFLDGSVLADTVHSGVTEFRTHLEIDSPEPEADIARIRAEFAERARTEPASILAKVEGGAK